VTCAPCALAFCPQVYGQVILKSFRDFSIVHSIRLQHVRARRGIAMGIRGHAQPSCNELRAVALNAQMPAGFKKKNCKFSQEVMPFRMKGMLLFYQPKWIGFLFAMVKPFLSAKLRTRVRMFGADLAALHELIDPAVLPAEFGGSQDDTGQVRPPRGKQAWT
jgi:hypothetical protein